METARSKGLLIFSEDTFLEFELVLFRKKFDKYFSKEERLQIVEKLHDDAFFVPVTSNIRLCRDPKDDKFLDLAIDTDASCIITGDKDLLVLHSALNNSNSYNVWLAWEFSPLSYLYLIYNRGVNTQLTTTPLIAQTEDHLIFKASYLQQF